MTTPPARIVNFATAHRTKKAAARRAEFGRLPHGPDSERLYRIREIEEVLPQLCGELTAHHLEHLRESDIPAMNAMLTGFAAEGRAMGFTARQWLSAGHLPSWVARRLEPALVGLERIAGRNAEIAASYTRWCAKADNLRKRAKAVPPGPAMKQRVTMAPEIARAEAMLREVLDIIDAGERKLSASRMDDER